MAATQLRAQQIKLGDGLTADGSNNVAVSLAANSGLEFSSGALRVDVKDNSLALDSDGLAVKLLSGGGISVDSNGLKLPLTTKGDLLAYSSQHDRLPVGTNGQVLTANSSATFGVEWANPSGGGNNFSINETPAGDVDGLNDVFVTTETPIAGTVQVWLNGLLQNAGSGNDYTISGDTITFESAPLSGDIIRVAYQY